MNIVSYYPSSPQLTSRTHPEFYRPLKTLSFSNLFAEYYLKWYIPPWMEKNFKFMVF